MFSNVNKPTFGTGSANTALGFGAQTSNKNPFAKSFSSPTTGTGPFGNTQSSTFGQPSLFSGQQTGFGSCNLFSQQQSQSTNSGLFGSNAFGQQSNAGGLGLGSSAQQTGIFAPQQTPPQQQNCSIFQPSGSTNPFGQSSAFGGIIAQNGTVTKFSPVTGTDTMQKGGLSTSINTKHYCITCMKEYEGKSFEELRYEDYLVDRKGPQQVGFGSTSLSMLTSAAQPMFGQGENKPAFGQHTMGFGQATPTFGQSSAGLNLQNQKGVGSAFGQPATGFRTATTGNIFASGTGANHTAQPFETPQQLKLFSSTTQPAFGSSTVQPTGFGAGLFGQSPNHAATGTGLFGKSTSTTAFSSGQMSAFSLSQPTMITSNTSKSTTGFPLFSQNLTANAGQINTMGQQPTGCANTFGKPTGQTFMGGNQTFSSVFGTAPQQPSSSSFETVAAKPNNLFGTNESIGARSSSLFGTTCGGLFPGASVQAPPSFNLLQPQQLPTQFPITEQEQPLWSISSSPFPISPHLSSLIPISKTDSSMYMRNYNEIKAIIESPRNRESTPKLKMAQISKDRKRDFSLFDGLDEEQAALCNSLTKRRSKCLIIKPKKKEEQKDLSDSEEELYELVREIAAAQQARELRNKNDNQDKENILLERNTLSTSTDIATQTDDEEIVNLFSRISSTTTRDQLASKTSPSQSKAIQVPEEREPTSDEYATPQSSSPTGHVTPPDLRSSVSKGIFRGSSQCLSMGTIGDIKIFDTSTSTPISITRTSDRGDEESLNESKIYRCGVICTRKGYYTVPSPDQLDNYVNDDGTCIIKGFTAGRVGYGNVYFPESIDVSNLNIDELIFINHKEITLYPRDEDKPPLGEGLNRRAQVTLDHIYPRDDDGNPVTNLDETLQLLFADFLKDQSIKQGTRFLEYRPETGSWVFEVFHFSKYDLRGNFAILFPTPEPSNSCINKNEQECILPHDQTW